MEKLKCPRCGGKRIEDNVYGNTNSPKERPSLNAKRHSRCLDCGWYSIWISDGNKFILRELSTKTASGKVRIEKYG